MVRMRGRRVLLAAGLTATPLLISQQPAAARVTGASDEETLEFVTNEGASVECTVGIGAQHNTDDEDQPYLRFSTTISSQEGCRDTLQVRVTATYDDSQGVQRRVTYLAWGPGDGVVEGAYTRTSVSARFFFNNCDMTQGDPCDVTVTASPK